jgi:major outer membrane protein
MKTLFLGCLAVLASFSASALPIGNPWEASLQTEGVCFESPIPDLEDCCNECFTWWDSLSLRVGYYGDFVFDRHLEGKRNHAGIHRTRIITNAGYLALNLCDLFDVFGTLGATNLHLTSANSVFGVFTGTTGYDFLDIYTNSSFSWSIGARGTIWQCAGFGFGAEAQYFHTCPKIHTVETEALFTAYPDNVDAKYSEWQVGIGVSYRINIAPCSTALVPYVGVKWSHCCVDMGNAIIAGIPQGFDLGLPILHPLRQERVWGWAVGMTLLGSGKASVTVEGQFANEKGLYVNGQFRF